MTWLIIGLVLLAAFGPIMWLRPSKKDKRLMLLREQARREGLVVGIETIPKLGASPEEIVSAGGAARNPTLACASYGRMLGTKVRLGPRYRLLRGHPHPDDPGFPFDDWQWDRPEREGVLDQEALVDLQTMLARVPADVVAVAVTQTMVKFYWLESAPAGPPAVSDLAVLILEFGAWIEAREAALGANESDDNS